LKTDRRHEADGDDHGPTAYTHTRPEVLHIMAGVLPPPTPLPDVVREPHAHGYGGPRQPAALSAMQSHIAERPLNVSAVKGDLLGHMDQAVAGLRAPAAGPC
jgi:hypothetical protein